MQSEEREGELSSFCMHSRSLADLQGHLAHNQILISQFRLKLKMHDRLNKASHELRWRLCKVRNERAALLILHTLSFVACFSGPFGTQPNAHISYSVQTKI
ncbi:hypothetical protein PRIPAC_86437 [Pristionchus pacificus]|uniref:Uncharacterized protein n=1 Tax=Pristionchus pacificus TaxID=54126 RepID=A0A2A6BRN1_PRIPA|nr:hypothetical protein PRIPAC_86437 [Pristionchus pacificus]|eukprot:PDM68589.1 hypothetical protein PRIPAC_46891 [Pristionchus pacificus]